MPWAAAMTSTLKVSSAAFTQTPTGEWLPPSTVNWSSIEGVPCRIFPATEREIQSIWGEALQIDAVCWVDPADVSLAVDVLTNGSGSPIPVQVTDDNGSVQYMAVRSRDLAHVGKLKAIGLRRFSHG